ncbi:MAG: glycosyltransferase family 2 protein [Actinomycetota bacterium]|nr:glycosyltransferase family 2 protein [Actinomycetota bacterium]
MAKRRDLASGAASLTNRIVRIEDLTYVLPLKWDESSDVYEMANYLKWLSRRCDVIVVDGSAPELFDLHAAAWSSSAKVIAPDPDLDYAMGKVNGVVTGIRHADSDFVLIGDDDVRYDDAQLQRIRIELEDVELVRPQNYFDPLPWHAAWDTARTLLNRSFWADYPGTLGIRRAFFMSLGGTYDGNTMFENLELMRTVEAGGGSISSPLDLYVRRMPPDSAHFFSQRVRQAYDDFAQPPRLLFFLSLLPVVVATSPRRRKRILAGIAGAAIAMAELGRQRAGGTKVFPPHTSLLAPAWVAERAVCSWLALRSRLVKGGIPYAGGIVPKAANSPKELRRRLASGDQERSRPGT